MAKDKQVKDSQLSLYFVDQRYQCTRKSIGSPAQPRLDTNIVVFIHRDASLLTLFLVNLSLYIAVL